MLIYSWGKRHLVFSKNVMLFPREYCLKGLGDHSIQVAHLNIIFNLKE